MKTKSILTALLCIPVGAVMLGGCSAVGGTRNSQESTVSARSEVRDESSVSARSEAPDESAVSEEGLTEQELAYMAKTDSKISDLTNGDEFQNASLQERTALAKELLTELADEGLIKKDFTVSGDMASFEYSCGVLGGIMLSEFDPMMN
ncbi:MAG: hypothetical protein IJ861_04925 [Clostridia bacterium]|nr:hypothetical protein [Clostridia bacterium]